MQERRSSVRSRSFLGGRIVFNNGSSNLDCLVKNVSAMGACIRLSEAVTVPTEFDLQIVKQGRSFRACLKWRRAEEFGVQLLPCEEEGRTSIETNLRVKKLEAEKEALRARVAQLSSAE